MITSMYKKYEHTIVISNRALVQGDFFEQMQKVICLHPHAVILREKDLPDEEYKMLAEKVLDMCREEDVNSFQNFYSKKSGLRTDSSVHSRT